MRKGSWYRTLRAAKEKAVLLAGVVSGAVVAFFAIVKFKSRASTKTGSRKKNPTKKYDIPVFADKKLNAAMTAKSK